MTVNDLIDFFNDNNFDGSENIVIETDGVDIGICLDDIKKEHHHLFNSNILMININDY